MAIKKKKKNAGSRDKVVCALSLKWEENGAPGLKSTTGR